MTRWRGKAVGGEANEIVSEKDGLNKLSASFDSERKRLRLAQLNSEFHEMEKQRIKLIGAYSQAAGTVSAPLSKRL